MSHPSSVFSASVTPFVVTPTTPARLYKGLTVGLTVKQPVVTLHIPSRSESTNAGYSGDTARQLTRDMPPVWSASEREYDSNSNPGT